MNVNFLPWEPSFIGESRPTITWQSVNILDFFRWAKFPIIEINLEIRRTNNALYWNETFF